jgi:hypothetical protein
LVYELPTAVMSQRRQRHPTFEFKIDGALFRFKAHRPVCAPSFQEPPRIAPRKRQTYKSTLVPFTIRSVMSQRRQRPPMLPPAFDGALPMFKAHRPSVVPLFQSPPRNAPRKACSVL